MQTVLIGTPCLLVGGTEIQTLRLVEALRHGNYRVVVVCYFEYDFNMVRQYKERGAEVVCLSAYGTRPEGTLRQALFLHEGLKRVVRQYKPDIAHVQYMAPGALPLLSLRLLGVKRLLATLHTDADIYRSLRLIHLLQRHLLRVFTCVTRQAEQSFFGSGTLYDSTFKLRRRNHFTLHNCLPAHFAHCERQPHEGFTIGAVLRLERIKGADLIIPAFAQIYRQHPQCRLLIVGDGSLRPKMEQQQRDCNLPQDAIAWIGRLAAHELPQHYARMDVAWVPSRSEGFGLSALEAMAQGCPVVAAQVGGLTEIISDNDNGLLFAAEDTAALAGQTIELLHDPQRRQRLAEAARERAADFSFEKYKERVLDLYAKLLG